MIFQVLYVIICCLFLISKILRKSSRKSSLAPPPLSGKLPFIGHGWKLLGDRKHAFDFVKSMSNETLQNGGVITINMGPQMMYIIADPDDCATVSNACLNKYYPYKFAKPFIGNGLSIADVPIWKQHRKYLTQVFRQKTLNGFQGVFNSHAKRLVSQLEPQMGKGPFDHEKFLRINSLETICMTSFGADVDHFGGLHKQYEESLSDLMNIFTERFQKFWIHNDFVYSFTNLKKREDESIQKINEFTSLVLKKRKAEMQHSTIDSKSLDGFKPFMNSILELTKETDCYSDEDILFETNTLVGGGLDTNAFTNVMTLILLGSYPEVQQKAYEELKEVFGYSDRDVDVDDLPKLVYLEAVIKESLRLYPVAPMIARYCDKDVELKNYTLKAGNGIGILLWAMHRHPIWGPDAEQFRPERWLDGTSPKNRNAFGAFSVGRRVCIGKAYAMMSMKTVLSHILRKYRISADISKVEFEIDVILKIASGQINIEERKQN